MKNTYTFLCSLPPDVRFLLYELAEINNVSQNAMVQELILNAAAEKGIIVPNAVKVTKNKRNNIRKFYRPPNEKPAP